jgi:hypothetical protein
MGQTCQADEYLEVLGDELGAVVGDDSGLGSGALSQGALETISTSASDMDWRSSWWTMAREQPSSREQR